MEKENVDIIDYTALTARTHSPITQRTEGTGTVSWRYSYIYSITKTNGVWERTQSILILESELQCYIRIYSNCIMIMSLITKTTKCSSLSCFLLYDSFKIMKNNVRLKLSKKPSQINSIILTWLAKEKKKTGNKPQIRPWKRDHSLVGLMSGRTTNHWISFNETIQNMQHFQWKIVGLLSLRAHSH